MWKKLACILLLASPLFAEQTKTVYNPFTSKLDYITKVDSTSLPSGSTQYIQNKPTLQTGNFYVSLSTISSLFTSAIYSTASMNFGGPQATFVTGPYATVYKPGDASGVVPTQMDLYPAFAINDGLADPYTSNSSRIFLGTNETAGTGMIAMGGASVLGPPNYYFQGFYANPTNIADNLWKLPNADGSTGQCLKTDGSYNLGWATASGGSGGIVSPGTFTWTNNFGLSLSTIAVSGVSIDSSGILTGNKTRLDVRSSMTVTDSGTSHNPNAGLIDIWKLNVGTNDPLLSIGSNNMNNQFVFKDSQAPYFSFGMTVGSLNVGVSGDSIYDNNIGASQGINFYTGSADMDIKTGFGGADILLRPVNAEAMRLSNTSGITASSSMTVTGAGGIYLKRNAASTPVGDYILNISSADRTSVFGIQNSGHVVSSGTAPSMGTCGTSPSVDGTDFAGVITVGSGVVTSCTINFASSYARSPVCVCSDNSTTVSCSNGTISTTAYTINTSATLGSGLLYYVCVGNKG